MPTEDLGDQFLLILCFIRTNSPAIGCITLRHSYLYGSLAYYWFSRRVSMESFVCWTTYRWSDFTLSMSINKEARNCWTWIKPASLGSCLWYRKVFNAANICLRTEVASFIQVQQFSPSLFIDNIKSDHLCVVWQTNDFNDMCPLFGLKIVLMIKIYWRNMQVKLLNFKTTKYNT